MVVDVASSTTLDGHADWVVAIRYQPAVPIIARCHPHLTQALERLVSADASGKIFVWDLAQRAMLHILDHHHGLVSGNSHDIGKPLVFLRYGRTRKVGAKNDRW